MLTNKKVNRFIIPILAIVLIYSVFKTLNTNKNQNQLMLDNNYVVGEIIDHTISGISENYYVKYQYYVNGIRFEKTDFYAKKFRDCHKTRKCIGLKYVVFYEKANPKNGFMNFNLSENEFNDRKNKSAEFKNKLEELKIE